METQWKLRGNFKAERGNCMVKKKRLSLDLPLDIHKELKILATTHNTTITKLVIRLVLGLVEQYKVEEENERG